MVDTKTAERPARKPPFAAPHVYLLAVVDGSDTTAVHRILQSETVIGRGDEADFRLDDDQVSNRHCMIRVEGSVCTLVELGSLNGTQVNARRVPADTAERLRHLDVIQLGGTRIMVLSGRFPERAEKD
jgi:pSer/pThr/pTyr-binding forkhead associated (FHA) protein